MPDERPNFSAAFKKYLASPPPGSAAARAAEFGIDLSITYGNMYGKTVAQRLENVGRQIVWAAELRRSRARNSRNT